MTNNTTVVDGLSSGVPRDPGIGRGSVPGIGVESAHSPTQPVTGEGGQLVGSGVTQGSQAEGCPSSFLPPSNNMGVDCTSVLQGLSLDDRCTLDYLCGTFKFPDVDTVRAMQYSEDILGVLEPRGCGFSGYSESFWCLGRTGIVAVSPESPQQGVHWQLPASALAELSRAGGFTSVLEWLCDVQALQLTVTRCDFAVDDHEGLLDPRSMLEAWDSGQVVSRFQERTLMDSKKRGDEKSGVSVLFGSRQSESCVRVYDKAVQQHVPGPWVRVELEVKGATAQEFVSELCSKGVAFGLGFLRGRLDFKVPGTDSNSRRWLTCDWWDRFLTSAVKSRVILPEVVRTIAKARAWFWRQVAPIAAVLITADGGSIDWIVTAAVDGRSRWRYQHECLLRSVGYGSI